MSKNLKLLEVYYYEHKNMVVKKMADMLWEY